MQHLQTLQIVQGEEPTLTIVTDASDGVSKADMEAVHTTEPQLITCPRCGSPQVMKYGIRNGQQEYICNFCRRKFNGKQAPFGMHFTASQIGAAIALYYDGLSLSDASRNMASVHQSTVNPATVYKWLMKYTERAIVYFAPSRPKVSDVWIVDETVVGVRGQATKATDPNTMWFWDIIDQDTRFLLASHLSQRRNLGDVVKLMTWAGEKAGKAPKVIISDSMTAYPDGIERVFGADSKHIQYKGLTAEVNGNLIERFHGTLKERVKVVRGFKTPETAYLILQGFLVNYNYFRPHMSLGNKTPAEAAGLDLPVKSWVDVVDMEGEA
ncbi:MAG: IS1/IS6 family transposase [Chloroflexi bacterium]|nr:IS1/IS6 family transposase [Chloroflexota bacterium]